MGKSSPKTLLKSCEKQSKGTPIYRPPKSRRWVPNQQSGLLAVDRPVDRPTVRFLTVESAVDRCLANGPAVDRPVDQAISREQRHSDGRPALGRARLCTSVDRYGRPTSDSVDRPVDRAIFREQKLSGGQPRGQPAQPVHVLCTLVDRPVDRPLSRSTVRATGRRPEK